MLGYQYGLNIECGKSSTNELLGPSNITVPFVACGDLTGFDADQSYPLQNIESNSYEINNVSDPSNNLQGSDNSNGYVYREPVQPPIHPNYYSYQKRQEKILNKIK